MRRIQKSEKGKDRGDSFPNFLQVTTSFYKILMNTLIKIQEKITWISKDGNTHKKEIIHGVKFLQR